MARKRMGIDFAGFEQYMEKLDELGGTKAMQRGVEEALRVSKQHVNPKIIAAMQSLPAGGKYSTGETKKSLDTDVAVNWDGHMASIKVGFDFSKSGPTSIFLMYGTPRMAPVKGLKAAIYGAKTKKEIAELQEAAMAKTIKRVMEG